MSTYRTLDDVDVTGRAVLVRVDLNVPVKDGTVTDVTRIERILPTLRELGTNEAKVLLLLAHFGRPRGKVVPQMAKDEIVIINMSGRGDKDVDQAARFILGGE